MSRKYFTDLDGYGGDDFENLEDAIQYVANKIDESEVNPRDVWIGQRDDNCVEYHFVNGSFGLTVVTVVKSNKN